MNFLLLNGFLVTIVLCEICVVSSGVSFQDDTTLTTKEREKLKQFKANVINRLPYAYMHTNFYLIKWLRSSNFDAKNAEIRLFNNLAWRKENNIETILTEDFSDIEDEFNSADGFDRLGRPYSYLNIGDLDLRRVILQGKEARLERFKDHEIEKGDRIVREMAETYGNITRASLILNVRGFNTIQHACIRCIPFLLNLVTKVPEHYPEALHQIIVVNTPAIAEPLINLGRPLFTKELNEILKVYGTNEKVWMKELTRDYDPRELPPDLGGTKTKKTF